MNICHGLDRSACAAKCVEVVNIQFYKEVDYIVTQQVYIQPSLQSNDLPPTLIPITLPESPRVSEGPCDSKPTHIQGTSRFS